MRTLLGIFVTALFCVPAHAIHVYAYYSCVSEQGLKLKYDGPGSNYAFGGYSNFYGKDYDLSYLSYENLEDENSSVGEIKDDFDPLHITFEVVENRTQGDVKVEPVDPTKCEGFEYEHSEWASIRTIKILDISQTASASLELTPGQVLSMKCDETRDVPVRCNNDLD